MQNQCAKQALMITAMDYLKTIILFTLKLQDLKNKS